MPDTVDLGYAAWLKEEALFAATTVAGAESAWGDRALDSRVISPLAYLADAQAVANDQADFLKGPLARDVATVPGDQHNLIGKLITIKNPALGYAAGALCFVIGAREGDSPGMTALTVLKRLYA